MICTIPFQEPRVKDVGVNGLQAEHLLWILADRLKTRNKEVDSYVLEKSLGFVESALRLLEGADEAKK